MAHDAENLEHKALLVEQVLIDFAITTSRILQKASIPPEETQKQIQ